MKRSEINRAIKEAEEAFARHGWALPPQPRWDVTDFGLGDFSRFGLVLVNLAEQPEYCEKIMYVRRKQVTPLHHHAKKKEDIVCRWGLLAIELAPAKETERVQVNGEERDIPAERPLVLKAGERITLMRGMKHAFWAESDYAIVGEVSTTNDDTHDNHFEDTRVGRFSTIVEDEPPTVTLVSD